MVVVGPLLSLHFFMNNSTHVVPVNKRTSRLPYEVYFTAATVVSHQNKLPLSEVKVFMVTEELDL